MEVDQVIREISDVAQAMVEDDHNILQSIHVSQVLITRFSEKEENDSNLLVDKPFLMYICTL